MPWSGTSYVMSRDGDSRNLPNRAESAHEGLPRDQDAAALRVQDVTTLAGFAALRPTWETLSAEAEAASPFNSWPWLWAWWRVFGAGKRLRLFVVLDGPRPVAIAPFYALHYGAGPLALRVLLPLGYGNDLTERLEPLIATGRRPAVLDALAAHLSQCATTFWDLLVWNGVASDELPSPLRACVRTELAVPYAIRPLPPTWDALVADLSPRMRAHLRYYPRRLARHGHTARVRWVDGSAALGPALVTFLRLHHARAAWRGGARHSDRFALPRHRAFLLEVAPALAVLGQLRTAILEVDGQDVAAQLTLEHAGTFSLYYSGVDPAWLPYGVGLQLTAACLRDAIIRGLTELDWLAGDGSWKRRWGAIPAPVARLALVRDAPHARAAFAAYMALNARLYDRAGQPRLSALHGVAAEHRLLQRLGALLRQPQIG